MLQVLIWGVCVMIIALGSIAKSTYTLTLPVEKRDKNPGAGLFFIFLFFAAVLFIISMLEGGKLGGF